MGVEYKASITREQFLFHEVRITAQLIVQGLRDEDIVKKIKSENLFQYPTEKSVDRMAKYCLERVHLLGDETLISALANNGVECAKQICLYSMMKYNKIVWDFMVNVVGEKFRTQNYNFSKMDVNGFIFQLQEQVDAAAEWSDTTISKIKQVLSKLLIDNGYIEDKKTGKLSLIWIDPVLENSIRANNDLAALPAFNCFR